MCALGRDSGVSRTRTIGVNDRLISEGLAVAGTGAETFVTDCHKAKDVPEEALKELRSGRPAEGSGSARRGLPLRYDEFHKTDLADRP